MSLNMDGLSSAEQIAGQLLAPGPELSGSEVASIARSFARDTPEHSLIETVTFEREPVPLTFTSPAPSMPSELLPDVIRPFVEDVAERMRVTHEMIAVALMISFAAVIGRRVGIRPKRRDDWVVIPNLWGAVVAESGQLKSPAVSEALKPFRRLEAEYKKAFDSQKSESDKQRALLELAISAIEVDLKAQFRKANGLADDPKSNYLKQSIEDRRRELDEVTARERRLSTQDATTEKLCELLRDNPRGLLVFRDEIVGFFKILDKAGREGDRPFYLESWNGQGAWKQDRIGRGSISVEALCLSLLGTTQPGPFREYIREATSEKGGADGLLQRLQLVVWPDVLPPWRNVDRFPDAEAKKRVFDVIKCLDAIDFTSLGLEVTDDGVPVARFDEAAQTVFDEWRDDLETRLRTDFKDQPALCSHMAKYRSLMPSLALLFHLISEAPAGLTKASRISENAARLAAAWCEFLELHARKVYLPAEGPLLSARELARHIERGDLDSGDSFRDVYGKHWARLDTPDRLEAAARILEDASWLKVIRGKHSGRGRPASPTIVLHPSLCTGKG